MDDPSIRVDGLRRSFGPVTALDGVDLDLAALLAFGTAAVVVAGVVVNRAG